MKNYILDTNVLLHDPGALLNFEENNVLIPIEVIEEVDRFKKESNELGQNARTVSRTLDGLRNLGSLNQGVPLSNGGRLQILFAPKSPNGIEGLNGKSVDSRILHAALANREAAPEFPSILVTKDINLRIKADAFGLPAEDYETDHVAPQDLYTGMREKLAASEDLQKFNASGELDLGEAGWLPNEFCTLIDASNLKSTLLAKVDTQGRRLVPLNLPATKIWGVKPRNREQRFALDALLDDEIKLVTLMGKAGTGKTLLAMAAGLFKTIQEKAYRRVVVARPTISMGRELGFLPGTLEEKLNPWMQPIYDALELLTDLNMGHENRRSEDLLRNGHITVEALSYIRGRSIANQFVIIDEAQNLTPIEVKTIVTRVGEGTKIVFTGDPYQIDNPYVDSASNGFNHVVSKLKSSAICAHVELQKGERSALAELGANLL